MFRDVRKVVCDVDPSYEGPGRGQTWTQKLEKETSLLIDGVSDGTDGLCR